MKKAAKVLGKSRTEADALVKADYSPSYARSGQIKRTKGWQEMTEKELPDKKLLQVHKEGLEATDAKGNKDFSTIHKYLDTAYKTKGRYAPVTSLSLNLSIDIDAEHKRIVDEIFPDETDEATD